MNGKQLYDYLANLDPIDLDMEIRVKIYPTAIQYPNAYPIDSVYVSADGLFIYIKPGA